MALTIYSFGYWGWGNHTEQLIETVDAVERHRGFRPPLFVDIRIHRAVRAKGFQGDAFERTVGERRHVWMPDLGNLSVLPQHRAPRIRIKRPAAAADLLHLARENARNKRHVIYFCSCQYPRWCHRHTVARLLVKESRRRNLALRVTEWPGGEPTRIPLPARVRLGTHALATRLPLISAAPLWRFAGIPFGTLVEHGDDLVPVCPVRYGPSGWYLPVLVNAANQPVDGAKTNVGIWRRSVGYRDFHSLNR